MTKTEQHLTSRAARRAITMYVSCVSRVGFDKACDFIDPTDEVDMDNLVNSVIDDDSKRQTNFLEGLGAQARQRFYANIADAANGGIQDVKRRPHAYGL